MSNSRKIVFGLTGSIAAFKACEVISSLVKDGHEVQVVTSPSVKNFIGDMTLEGLTKKVVINDVFQTGKAMEHIDLLKWADLIIICPITANKINELASGVATDMIGNLFLAFDFKKPWILVPAMNPHMYDHPITQRSLKVLKELGLTLLGPDQGVVACGDEGYGRMLEAEAILTGLSEYL